MYQICIFDLDGTLLDTVESIAYSANMVLEKLGYQAQPVQNYNYYAGDGQRELLKRALYDAGDTEAFHLDEATVLYREFFSKHCTFEVKPYPGIRELLNQIKDSGRKIAVLSNKPHYATVNVVESIFGKDYFDLIQGQQDDLPRKPDPTGAMMIARHFHEAADVCLYIGDTDTDMKTGNAAKMDTVGVLWGFRSRKELEAHQAKYIVSEAAEIWEIING